MLMFLWQQVGPNAFQKVGPVTGNALEPCFFLSGEHIVCWYQEIAAVFDGTSGTKGFDRYSEFNW